MDPFEQETESKIGIIASDNTSPSPFWSASSQKLRMTRTGLAPEDLNKQVKRGNKEKKADAL